MLALPSSSEAGKRLRAKRERRHLSIRDVERFSQQIVEEKKNPAYYVPHNWVSDLENGKSKPRLAKFHSLSLIYECDIGEILALGADCVLTVVPYYNKPPQKSLVAHFKAIAGAIDVPVMLYNVPSRTVVNMAAETTIELSHVSNIVALKEASTDLTQFATEAAGVASGFRIYSGEDSLTLPMMSVGGHGVVSVAGHFAAKGIRAMIEAFVDGRVEQAAPPDALYARPATTFAARFIGTPPMNILPAAPDKGGLLFGVRPEDVTLGDVGIPVRVQSSEFLGADTVVTCAYGNHTLAARVPGKAGFAAGDAIHARWRGEHVHVFDAASGARRDDIRAPAADDTIGLVQSFA